MTRSSAATPAEQVLQALKRAGIDLVVSLPDKWLTDLLKAAESDPELTHVRVTREDDGVGICAGAYLGGRRGVLVCQNAGLLLATNALAGVAQHHQIPLLILAAYRGNYDDGYYYQIYKGRVTEPVVRAIGLPLHLVRGPEDFHLIEDAARQALLARTPAVLLLDQRALVGESGQKVAG